MPLARPTGDATMYTEFPVQRWDAAHRTEGVDSLAVEEPLEIRVNGGAYAVTMRTPGNDLDLAAGFLVAEGILGSPEQLYDLTQCADPDRLDLLKVVNAYVDPERVTEDALGGRQRYATSSCGLCGRASIDAAMALRLPALPSLRMSRRVISALPGRMREAQEVFARTGGLHAAGLFNPAGELLYIAEDIGRHNAVDKVIGRAFLSGPWPLCPVALMVSGRAGFEIVQKAAAATIPLMASVSAPSSLAVDLALQAGITLIGFLRGETMNVYAGPERITE